MEGIRLSTHLELQIIATGSHLSPEFGFTYREIESDGFSIDRKIEMVLSADTPSGVAKSMGVGLIGFASAFQELKPDWIVLLGDRYELLSAASAALVARIPIVHIHGGETTEGAFDEAIRHSITKMSHLHFVAADAYRRRVIQLGEDPQNVHVVGGLGLDGISKIALLGRSELEQALDFKLGARNLLITFHPVTLESESSETQMRALLNALDSFPDIHCIFTMPNADNDSRVIFRLIEEFTARRANSKAFTSLGQLRYLSCLRHVDGVVGNSSSGLIEVPSFRKATINVGDRQKGRLRAQSVLDCNADSATIRSCIERIYSEEFQNLLSQTVNPYGSAGASEKIVKILEARRENRSVKKTFYDLKPGDLA
jgi:GDP/UDP-N,N'-diacetylbacillosamine 2-epimerase (hydrolysing)